MFQTPLRALVALRPNVPALVVTATAVSTVVFTTTPFLVTGLAEEFEISPGRVGLISGTQLAGFVLSSWGAGRVLRPRRRLMVFAVLLGMVANIASAVVGFEALLALRFASGLALGTIAWLAWAEVFGEDERVGDVAVIGPIVGTVASPIVAALIDRAGPAEMYLVLGALHIVPLFFVRSSRLASTERVRAERHRPRFEALVAMCALGVFTLGGSAIFIFTSSIAQGPVGMSAVIASLVFSVNSIAGIPSARFRGARRHAGMWIGVTALAAVTIAVVHHPLAFVAGMVTWGFGFWMAVPAAFSVLAEHSNYPAERAGDAQAYMAMGRVVGPMLGGLLYDAGLLALGIVGGLLMASAGAVFAILARRPVPELRPA